MRWLNTVIVIGWLIFWIYWFATAKNSGFRQSALVNRGQRAKWFLMAVAVLIILSWLWNLSQPTIHNQPAVHIAGAILFFIGLGLAIWARRHLGHRWGLPMTITASPKLVTSGPYQWIRHPIYVGLILAALGSGLTLNRIWLVIFVFSSLYWLNCAVQEEKLLTRRMPKTYLAYQRQTKMLIPYLY